MNFPSLQSAKIISLDVETKDPDLVDKGPSTFRGGGHICGVSIATDDGFCEYLPVRHETGENLDEVQVFSWLKKELATDIPKIGANITYDLEWLRVSGVRVAGKKLDVQTAEALIDENKAGYSLDSLAYDYLQERKNEKALVLAAALRGIGSADVKKNIWRLSPEEVSEYGKTDVLLPLRIFEKQLPEIASQELQRVFDVECRLIDVLQEMRFKGVRIDPERAQQSAIELRKRKKLIESSLMAQTGRALDYWSGKAIAAACDSLGIPYLKTEKGNPSFEADWLNEQEHPFLKQVALARLLDRSGEVFIQNKILDVMVKDRIHPQIYSVRNNRGGTRSGRFSMANPNMQQVPARHEEMARIIRDCFIPEDGCEWACFDWSQIEPRITVHYAYLLRLKGAEEARQRYIDDPSTDYHQLTADMAGIERKPAKIINLGLSYGMGKEKLANSLGLSFSAANDLFNRYHDSLPFIGLLNERCQRSADKKGYIKTLLGRRRHYDFWSSSKYSYEATPLKREEAEYRYGKNIKRCFLHTAMNAVIQGTAADLMKVLLVKLYDEGIVPHLTVHDDISESCKSKEEILKIKTIMEKGIQEYFSLHIPLKTDVEVGSTWGSCKEISL